MTESFKMASLRLLIAKTELVWGKLIAGVKELYDGPSVKSNCLSSDGNCGQDCFASYSVIGKA